MNPYQQPREENMTSEAMTQEFILLYRGVSHRDLSPEQMQQIVKQYTEWVAQHRQRGQFLGGKPLEDGGRVVTGKDGQMVSDGPFMESKEIVVGFMMLRAANLDDAVVIAQGCPILSLGGIVEVRPVITGSRLGQHEN
jgi:hypothetical protein